MPVYQDGLLVHLVFLSQSGLWWWNSIHFAFGSALSGIALTSFIFIMASNVKFARWDRIFYLAISSVVPTILLFFTFSYLFAVTENANSLRGVYIISAFFIQIVPAVVGPYVYQPIFGDLMKSPVKLSILSILLTVAVALIVLDVLTPMFAKADSLTRILIRVIAFPLLIEIPAGAVRVAARYWLSDGFPLQRILLALLGPVMLSSIVGRFLTTNMESIGETFAVAILLSLVEVLMRSTMLWRDDLYVACCGRPCGGRAGKKKHQRAEAHSWVMFMLFETMVEDVSILLSLPVTLLMRIPPLPGGEPLGAGDVVVRVLIQYVIETLTDVGFALGYYVMTAWCGVRYNAVSFEAMESRFTSTKVRRDEQHRYLFLPRTLRRAIKSVATPTSSPSRAKRNASNATAQTAVTPSRINIDDSGAAPSPSRGINAPASPALSPATSIVSDGSNTLSETASGTLLPPEPLVPSEAFAGDDPQLAFCSCTPCCLPRNHPLARRTRQQLKQELKQEVRWEREFLWQPMPIGLVAYQALRPGRCLQPSSGYVEQNKEIEEHLAASAVTADDAQNTTAHSTTYLASDEMKSASAADADNGSAASGVEVSQSLQADAVGVDGSALLPSAVGQDGAGAPVTPRTDQEATELTVDTAERGLMFDQLVAEENGTEADGSLDRAFDPSVMSILTIRMEIVAVMFLRGWETRFKNFNWMLAFGVVAGSLYVLRTFVGGALCPFGDPDDSANWKYDYCK